jgi:dolichol-phosphate mannosyltransferase
MPQRLEYFRHMRLVFVQRYGTWAHLAQFLVVGTSGLAVNLLVLTAILRAGLAHQAAIAVAIAVSMTWNFALNRRFSFSYARKRPIVTQYVGFVAACSVGGAVNYVVTAALWETFHTKQLAATLGVAAGTGFNFVASRFAVFRMKDERTSPPTSTRGG